MQYYKADCISIIMPCYNAARHLTKSIGSVQGQTYANWEIVCVDDGSTDNTLQLIQEYARNDPRIRTHHQPNKGVAATRNAALSLSHGTHAAFLDADDTWHPEFLAAMHTALSNHPDAGLAYCGWQNIGLGGGRDEPFIPPEYENEHKIESLLGGCRWPIHAVMTYTKLLHEVGGFDEDLATCGDYDLWLRLATRHKLIRVPRVLAYYHHHGVGQLTGDRARIALNHWRAQQKFLRANPETISALGDGKIRELTQGELLKRGYVSYWKRDLPAARKIFRAVMQQGYGSLKDWLYMLPSWLPESWHRLLLKGRDARKIT